MLLSRPVYSLHSSALPRHLLLSFRPSSSALPRHLLLSKCGFAKRENSTSAGVAAANTLAIWHALVEDGKVTPQKLDKLRSVVDDECVFKPPTYYSNWKGGDETTLLLGCAAEVFGESFTYGRQWISDDGRDWALEFTADVGASGKSLEGIDLVKLNEAGHIVEFTVLARPPSGVAAMKSEMMKLVPHRLAALKSRQALDSLASAVGFGSGK